MKNHDLMGSHGGWGGGWGQGWGGGPGFTAFGGEFDGPMLPAGGAGPDPRVYQAAYANMRRYLPDPAAMQMAGGLDPFGGGCGWGNPAFVDPALVNSMIAKQHSVLVGPDFGPQEVEQMLGSGAIADLLPGASVSVEFTPELICKLTRLFIPTSIASQIVVVDLSIGIKSQFPGKGRIPGLVFSEVSTNNRINGDTCYIRQPIVLTLLNCSESTIPGNCFACAVGVVAVQGGGPRIIGPGSGHA